VQLQVLERVLNLETYSFGMYSWPCSPCKWGATEGFWEG